MYTAKVKWNGNHYFHDEVVKGSKMEQREDGTYWLFDDEDSGNYMFPPRNEWVEVQPATIEEVNQ